MASSKLPIPEEELFFQVKTVSKFQSTWLRVPRSMVILRWNLMQSGLLNQQQKQRAVTALRRFMTKEGDLVLKSSRYDDVGANLLDVQEKLTTLVFAALTSSDRAIRRGVPTKQAQAQVRATATR